MVAYDSASQRLEIGDEIATVAIKHEPAIPSTGPEDFDPQFWVIEDCLYGWVMLRDTYTGTIRAAIKTHSTDGWGGALWMTWTGGIDAEPSDIGSRALVHFFYVNSQEG